MIHPLPADWMEWDAARLEREITDHNRRYWDEQNTIISDYDFDQLTERLRALTPDSPVLDALGPSEAGRIGETVTHARAMLSLEKCYDEATLLHWAEKLEGPFVMSPKIDGVAAALRYVDGRLSVVATRGTGTAGEDITANARQVTTIPERIPITDPVEVRGEIYVPLSVFEPLRAQFANPRNTAAGALKQKDPQKSARIGLAFFAYDVLGAGVEAFSQGLSLARDWGFVPVEFERLEAQALQTGYEGYVARRSELDYEIDGVVYRADRVAEYERAGNTAHHPRGAIAYKLQGDSATTILRNVEWSVSRTGVLTPVGIVEPVTLSGATVTRISLHNWGLVRAKKLSLDAEGVAMRRGGVIPHLEAVARPGTTPIEPPASCPSCGAAAQVRGDVVECTDPSRCGAVLVGALSHYANGVDIEGFGRVWLETLVDAGVLKQPADFYRLAASDLLGFERMGETLAHKLVANVEKVRQVPLAMFLAALGVPDLGKTAATTLARRFRSLDAVRQATEETLALLDKFAEITARHVVGGLAERAAQIDALLEHVTVIEHEESDVSASAAQPLAGQSFLFTGTLSTMKRGAAVKRVQALGASAASGVSKRLTYLVIGSEGRPGSKVERARKAGVKLLQETEFATLIEGLEAPDEGTATTR